MEIESVLLTSMQGMHTLHSGGETEEVRFIFFQFLRTVGDFIAFILLQFTVNLTIYLYLEDLTVTIQISQSFWTNEQKLDGSFWMVSSGKAKGKDYLKSKMVASFQPHDLHMFCRTASFSHLQTKVFQSISTPYGALGCSYCSSKGLKGLSWRKSFWKSQSPAKIIHTLTALITNLFFLLHRKKMPLFWKGLWEWKDAVEQLSRCIQWVRAQRGLWSPCKC